MPINSTTTTTTGSSRIKDQEAMKLHLTKGELFQGIQSVQSAISTRSTLPILSNILFEASDNGLRLSATDLEVGIRTWVKADVVKPGAVTIPAKILSDFLKTLDDDRELNIDVEEGAKVKIKSGRDRLNVTGLPRADYPVLPEFEKGKATPIPKVAIREVLKKTIFASSSDETRYVLNGIHLVVADGKMTGVATDGRRLAYIQRPITDTQLNVKVIVPTKAVQEVLRMVSEEKTGETIQISFTDNQASFFDGETTILSRLIEGHYPNYEQVIPKSHEIELRLKRADLLSSVTRAAVGTLERGGSVKFTLSQGVLRIQAAAQGRVEVESELPVSYEGKDFDIAFNPLYIIDALKALSQEEIVIEFGSALNPGVIKPIDDDSYRYVMMPMKI